MQFKSNIIIHPGLGNSEPGHWQSLWVKKYGFIRVEQRDFETPVCTEWTAKLNDYVLQHDPREVILVGHSMACIAIAYWAQQYNVAIKAALLVAPSDTEASTFPAGTTGYAPVPLIKLPFPSVVVGSTNDYYITRDRAKQFADSWGSSFVEVGAKGHINLSAGFGEWDEGLELLKAIDES